MFDDYCDIAETARIWHCNPETVKRLIRKKAIPARKFSGKWLVAKITVQHGYPKNQSAFSLGTVDVHDWPDDTPPNHIPIRSAARKLNLSYWQVLRAAARGDLPAMKTSNGRWWIKEEAVSR